MEARAKNFSDEISSELKNIMTYWKQFSIDNIHGGFVGRRDHYNHLIENAPKGAILNTRLLWSFSAVANFEEDKESLKLAERAWNYIEDNFWDKEYNGVFWELDAQGQPKNTRKQIYAQAFAIYALAEYYNLAKTEKAKDRALELFDLIETHARNIDSNGYLEAFQRDWTTIEDMRLSEKDLNSAKTMNTHLHILEAYTLLMQVTNKPEVKEALENLVVLFLNKFLDNETGHYRLFFDVNWNSQSELISYGHDIEAAWLLVEAAKATKNNLLIENAKKANVLIAEVFLKEGYQIGKGVLNEKNLKTGEVDTDRHWWPQVEAMVGLDYAWKISGNKEFLEAKYNIWSFTKKHLIDRKSGEWFFRIDCNNSPYANEDKLSMWKAPYHNSRALLMLLNL
jgi:mannobiose 2-epimerase